MEQITYAFDCVGMDSIESGCQNIYINFGDCGTFINRKFAERMIPIEAHDKYGMDAAKKAGRIEAESVYKRLAKMSPETIRVAFPGRECHNAIDVINALSLDEIDRILNANDTRVRESQMAHRGDWMQYLDEKVVAITTEDEHGNFNAVDKHGNVYTNLNSKIWKRTGLHSDEIDNFFGGKKDFKKSGIFFDAW